MVYTYSTWSREQSGVRGDGYAMSFVEPATRSESRALNCFCCSTTKASKRGSHETSLQGFDESLQRSYSRIDCHGWFWVKVRSNDCRCGINHSSQFGREKVTTSRWKSSLISLTTEKQDAWIWFTIQFERQWHCWAKTMLENKSLKINTWTSNTFQIAQLRYTMA